MRVKRHADELGITRLGTVPQRPENYRGSPVRTRLRLDAMTRGVVCASSASPTVDNTRQPGPNCGGEFRRLSVQKTQTHLR